MEKRDLETGMTRDNRGMGMGNGDATSEQDSSGTVSRSLYGDSLWCWDSPRLKRKGRWRDLKKQGKECCNT